MRQTRRCSITGMGVVSPIGVGIPAFWRSLSEGHSGIKPVRAFSTEAFSRHLGAELPEGWEAQLDAQDWEEVHDSCAAYALIAAREALANAGLCEGAIAPERLAVVLGTNLGNLSSMVLDEQGQVHRRPLTIEEWRRRGAYTQTAAVARALGAKGPLGTIVTACAASTNALGYARDLLLAGEADVVLAGGADVMALELFSGFFSLGAISPAACAPFSEPYGMTIGEGAGIVVLEREEHAAKRGANTSIALLGYGLSSDGHHVTTPDPLGRGVGRSLKEALQDAGVRPEAVDLVNAHGTGTEANDAAEWQGISLALGERAKVIPVNSVKGFFGHPQGAAGIMELIATMLAMEHEVVLPTLNSSTLRPHCPVDPVHEPKPRPAVVDCALKNSSAFGGANASVVIGRASVAQESTPREEAIEDQEVVIVSTGLIGAHGEGSLRDALMQQNGWLSWREEAQAWVGEVPKRALGRWGRHPAMRDLDPSAMFLTAAVSAALRGAGIRLRGVLQEQTGLIVGVNGHDPFSASLFATSMMERGPAQASATAFAHSVPNASAGTTASVLSIKGLHSVLSGPHSGLWSIVYATRMLATRPDVHFLVAGGVDELSQEWIDASKEGREVSETKRPSSADFAQDTGQYIAPGEGAACVVLARRATAIAHGLPILATISSTWTAGPAQAQTPGRLASWLDDAAPDGLYSGAGSGLSRELAGLRHLDESLLSLPRFHSAPLLGEAVASGAACALVGAVEALHSGQLHHYPDGNNDPHSSPSALLTFAEDPSVGSCALLLKKGTQSAS